MVLEAGMGQCTRRGAYGHRKSTSKINEVDSKVEDRFLKLELQMQLMAKNMKRIMQIIAHRLDT